MAGVEFLGVNDLTLEHVKLWNVRAFGALIANGERITIRDVTVDHGGGPNASTDDFWNTDGLHFKGPLRYVNIEGVRFRVGDDALAFDADDYDTDDLAKRNDFGPYVRSGPITDVTVNDVQLMETLLGIRVVSARQRVDRIVISNVTGTVRGYAVNISHWLNPTSLGNVGSVLLSNINVDRGAPEAVQETDASREQDRALRKAHPQWWSLMDQESNHNVAPFCTINGHVEHLVLSNMMTHVVDDRPILRLGRDADVQLLTAELHLLDPALRSTPVRVDAGAHVGRLNLRMDWEGKETTPGARRNPVSGEGRIDALR